MSQSFLIVLEDRIAGPYTASAGETSFTYAFALLAPEDLLIETAPAATPISGRQLRSTPISP